MKKLFLIALITCLLGSTCQAQIADNPDEISPIGVGEMMPTAILTNSDNEDVILQTVLARKPTVMILYRGGWCPYCNVQLSDMAKAEKDILKLGYQIIAVTPESSENITPTMNADKLKYEIFSDPKAELIQKLGIAFKTPEDLDGYISSKSKGPVNRALPVPTVLVISEDGRILYQYVNVDYKTRLSSKMLIKELRSLD